MLIKRVLETLITLPTCFTTANVLALLPQIFHNYLLRPALKRTRIDKIILSFSNQEDEQRREDEDLGNKDR